MTIPALFLTSTAPGSGTTTVCLALARALAQEGHDVAAFKAGGDVRDALLHGWALQRPCLNLDGWAQRTECLLGLFQDSCEQASILLGDGHGGLFDTSGAADSSDTSLAALLGIPILLVIDVRHATASIAPMIEGVLRARGDVKIDGIFLNRARSVTQVQELIRAFDDHFSTPVTGYLLDDPEFEINDVHYRSARMLEGEDIDKTIDHMAAMIKADCDLMRMQRLAQPANLDWAGPQARPLPALGQRIAVAQDEAFAYGLEAILTGWRRQGAQVFAFSPLDDEPPPSYADAVYLPPGHIEGYTGKLAACRNFQRGLAQAASRRAVIFGEGLGYGVLGEFMIDEFGERHAMSALLPVTTHRQPNAQSHPYHKLRLQERHVLGMRGTELRGMDLDGLIETDCRGERLFELKASSGESLGTKGCIFETASGSPIRLIDRHPHLSLVRG